MERRCLRNQHHSGLYNGTVWFIERIVSADEFGGLVLEVRPEDEFTAAGDDPITVTTHQKFFLGRESELDIFEREFCVEFDHGYALTVHKAQGSQWPNIFIVDEFDEVSPRLAPLALHRDHPGVGPGRDPEALSRTTRSASARGQRA